MTIKRLSVALYAVLLVVVFFIGFSGDSEVAQATSDSIQLSVDNTVVIRGVVSEESMSQASIDLITLNNKRGQKNYPIYIVLDTPGGSIDAGLSFISTAKTVPNVKTITIFAASMGSAIVESLEGERLMIDTATLMFHRAAAQIDGQLNDGELESRLAWIKSIVTSMEQTNAKRLQLSLPEYKAKVANELWMFGQAAIDQHAADKIASFVCTEELFKSTVTQSMQVGPFLIKVPFSGCPLIRGPVGRIPESDESI
jgi:ATP-dependent protease ClpP protease subunit